MTEKLKSEQTDNEIIDSLEFETPEQERVRIIGAAIAARTIKLDTRHDNSFKQSKTPEEFFD